MTKKPRSAGASVTGHGPEAQDADAAGQPRSAEKKAEVERLLHRVKNDMQLVVSLLSLQAMQETDPAIRRKFNQMSTRVRSLALLQEQLYRSGRLDRINIGDYVRALSQAIAGPHDDAVHLTVDAAPVDVALQRATPIALIVNELLCNCFEHAFPGGREGEVRLTVAEEDDRIRIVIADDGVGLPDDADRTSGALGLRLVQTLARQLSAEVKVAKDGGTRYAVLVDR